MKYPTKKTISESDELVDPENPSAGTEIVYATFVEIAVSPRVKVRAVRRGALIIAPHPRRKEWFVELQDEPTRTNARASKDLTRAQAIRYAESIAPIVDSQTFETPWEALDFFARYTVSASGA